MYDKLENIKYTCKTIYIHTYELVAIKVSNCVWMYINKNKFLQEKEFVTNKIVISSPKEFLK